MRNMKKVWPNGLSSDLYLLASSLNHREASSNSHLHSEVADDRARIARQEGKHAARQACWGGNGRRLRKRACPQRRCSMSIESKRVKGSGTLVAAALAGALGAASAGCSTEVDGEPASGAVVVQAVTATPNIRWSVTGAGGPVAFSPDGTLV